MLIQGLLKRQSNNNKIAIKQGNSEMTYCEWNHKSLNISKIITKTLNEDSKNISTFLPNSLNYAVSYFAILFSNKVIVPIGVESKAPEINSTLKYCEIDFIITNCDYILYLKNALKKYKYKINIFNIDTNEIIVINECLNYAPKTEVMENCSNSDDVAIMLHTSGTTSNPKRVMLTHKNLISNIESNIESLDLNKTDKVLIALPMIFGYCNTAQFLTHIYLGASIVILENIFLPRRFFKVIEKEKITNFTGVPSMLLMILGYDKEINFDYSSLKFICFGGGKIPKEQLKSLITKFPTIGFVHTYGLTEASPRVTALMPSYSLDKIGSVGQALPNVEVKIVEESRVDGFIFGEIIVRGQNIMHGYYKHNELTNNTIKNGWLYTGDLGYFDEDGFLYLTSRKKNIIISGGLNIYPEEIEEVLITHPLILDVCVVAEEHNILGEIPVAKIILKEDKIDDLYDYCLNKLSEYKIPKRFDKVKEIPKTYNGKNKRRLNKI